ncbi:MAG: NAD(P)/FAD-dependent oxidoreductase [Clostridiales bacterium]|nr:NAD(P)/FAD-dependent oxidoreductase [Clostridiales bacterium]
MNYVIIGNSAAAIGCIEGIRQIDAQSLITVIASEPYHTYSRPLISYLLYGKTDEQRMKYRPDGYYEKMGVKAMLGRTVEKIDPKAKKVTLENGEQVKYDKLLVATGSRPFIPPMEGLDTVENKHTFMSLDDAKGLEAALKPDSRVLIVGAGLIGLKCAEGIQDKVGSITVVDLASRILPSILDEAGSRLVQEHIESKGIRFLLGDSVAAFDGDKATLKSGGTLEFDILVIAVGVRPNVELLKDAGAEVERGIVTDAQSRTSLKDVFAAGDCAQSHDITTGTDRVLALLPNAYMQGECAGITMAGGEKAFDKAIPMNAIGFFGLHMITAGSYDGDEYIDAKEGSYKKLVTKDGLLKGYILIGDIRRAGIYTSLIREQTPLAEIDFDRIKEKPQLMAFAKAERAKKLGGQ